MQAWLSRVQRQQWRSAWLLFVTTIESTNILLTTIKFTTFQDCFVKFKDFKALNLVQSNSRLSRPCTDSDIPSRRCRCHPTWSVHPCRRNTRTSLGMCSGSSGPLPSSLCPITADRTQRNCQLFHTNIKGTLLYSAVECNGSGVELRTLVNENPGSNPVLRC